MLYSLQLYRCRYMDSYFLQCNLFIVNSVTYFGARSIMLGVSLLSLP